MDAETALRMLGGVGSTAEIVGLSSRRSLDAALRRRRVVRVARARYVLADLQHHRRAAARLSGVTSHLSAAQHWGWPVKEPPEAAWVIVPRSRKVDAETRATTEVCYADLREGDVVEGVTTKLRTVLDCARRLPFDEALAVAGSALRAHDLTPSDLNQAAAAVRGPGGAQVRRVASAADARAANPFESALRAIVLELPELHVVPQQPVPTSGLTYHPDLVDDRYRLVIEAESWSWHADQQTHSRDCVRFTLLTVAGWTVLRFTWPQVMNSPSYVRRVLAAFLAREAVPSNVQSPAEDRRPSVATSA